MEDRPVQEGYHRPARKKKRAGLPAFFLAVIVLALLAAALLRIWLGYRSGSLAAGDITPGWLPCLPSPVCCGKSAAAALPLGALLWRSLRSC